MEFSDLVRSGLHFPTVERIMSASEPVKRFMFLGLPRKTIRGICETSGPCVIKGSKSSSHLSDACSSC